MTLVRRVFGDRSDKSFQLKVPGHERSLGRIRDFVDEVCAELGVASKTTNSMKLAIDEACANIIKHAYREKDGSIEINISTSGPNHLSISLTDQGESFELQKIHTPDLRRYVATGRKGGLGLFLMNRLMDEVNYDATPAGNVLTMRKNLLGKRKRPPLAWRKTIWHKSLRFKFSVYASGILLTIIAVAFSYFGVRQEKAIVENITSKGEAIANAMARQSTELLLSRMALSVEQTLLNETIARTLEETPYIASIVVVDTEGNVWASGKPSQLFGSYESVLSEARAEGQKPGNALIPLATPVVIHTPGSPATELGTVHVQIRMDSISFYVARARRAMVLIALLVFVVGSFAIWSVVSLFVKPIQKLSDGVRAIGEGMLDRTLEEGGPDEIDEIARAFNEITARFRKAQHSVVEKERLQKEMQVAQEIQQSLLPGRVPDAEGFEIGTLYRAAKEVGGDYYDFVWVDDDTLGIVVGDVSGKGVPGSLVMTMIRTALRMEARGNRSARDVVSRMNSFVTEDMKKGMFVTIFYVVLDSRHRVISYASAGHNPMVLYRGDSSETYFLNPKGFPVGIDLADHSLFEKSIGTETIKLKQSDMLVIYTDGITEAMNSASEQFGEERLLKAIKKHGHMTSQEFADTLNREVADFTGGEPQNDDITLVAIKEKAVADDIIYDVRRRLIDLVESEGVSVGEACEIMKVSPSTYYRYRRRMHELGEDGLRDKTPRALERLGRVSLEVQQRILRIVSESPAYGPKRISRQLKQVEYGGLDVSPRKIYACLRRLKLSTRREREQLAAEGRAKIMDLDVSSSGRSREAPVEEAVCQGEETGLSSETGYTQAGQESEEIFTATQSPAAEEETK
ncbi:MAG: SpoIIE family protein phosphatase [Candidatus Eiseniibacteriota bacterium]|nr:MAG: SpoIIE family protein phosphatase [Candidatus Eisenbacteria bacterium]